MVKPFEDEIQKLKLEHREGDRTNVIQAKCKTCGASEQPRTCLYCGIECWPYIAPTYVWS